MKHASMPIQPRRGPVHVARLSLFSIQQMLARGHLAADPWLPTVTTSAEERADIGCNTADDTSTHCASTNKQYVGLRFGVC
eukprot:822943-Amphidinium_carterae.1